MLGVELGTCNFRGCWNDATTKGFIYGHYRDKKDSKDKFIDVVACDDHAKEKDFYPKENRNETNI